MEPDRVWNLVANPAWRPVTEADAPGYAVLLTCAAALVALTIWTYVGSASSTPRRVTILIALRLAALFIAVITAIRPAAAITEIPKLPSTLIVIVDSSESMTLRDEANSTRWEVIKNVLEKCGPIFDQLRDDQQVTLYQYHFNKDFDPDRDTFTDDVKPDGKRTDFGTMLAKLYDRHQGDRLLRGLIIVSDGADNGVAKPAIIEAARWRGIGCPVYCFAVGSSTTTTNQKDIGFTSISPDPSPVAIKSDLKVKAKLNARGFEGRRIEIKLLFDGVQQAIKLFELTKSTDNEIEIEVKAPEKPGEVRVTLELVDPPPNQVTTLNDKIETYLTVTKEGVRVLVISKEGFELQGIRRALASDKRFDFVEVVRASEAVGTAEDAKKYDFSEQRYDAIILGDVSPKMLTSVRPELLKEIKDLVTKKGVGLMMTGGAFSLGGTAGIPGSEGWRNTPIADILPVDLPTAPAELPKEPPPVRMAITKFGEQHYLLKLNVEKKKSDAAWESLNTSPTQLEGFAPLGKPKPRAEVLATVDDPDIAKSPPLLVRIDAGNGGRVLAFGASNTYLWTLPSTDPNNRRATFDLHARFWKQMVLWLAHQDEVEGNAYVRPEFRRLVASGQQTIKFGLRDKRGDELPDADLRYQVLAPGDEADKTKAKRTDRDPAGGGKVSFEAKVPGEYRVVGWGEGADKNGEKIADSATARYVVYPDVSDELLNPAARPDILLSLENTANGTALDAVRRADRLPAFIEEIKANPVKTSEPKPKAYPDWRRDKSPWFLPAVLVLFTAVLGFEWGLRRMWGMV